MTTINEESPCPFCAAKEVEKKRDTRSSETQFAFTCKRCGSFVIAEKLLRMDLSDRVVQLNLHLVSGHVRESLDKRASTPFFLNRIDLNRAIDVSPKSIPQKADKLLSVISRRTEYFGQVIEFTGGVDYPLAYAKNQKEFANLMSFLAEQDLISRNSTGDAILRPKGFEAIESSLLLPSVTVFVSSTCHDLGDLRAEIAEFLEASGLIVKLSEDPFRFDVDPNTDSIRSCVQNVEASNVVVCILDRRYGGVIDDGEFKGLSATHVEIRHARDKGIPVFSFIREPAMADYNSLRRDPKSPTSWVEREKADRRAQWLELAKELIEFEPSDKRSNWVTQFKNSVDLKKLVLHRIQEFRRNRAKQV